MKLVLLIPSLQSGGMERVMSQLADYFCKQPELQVHLVLYGLKRDIFYEIPENLKVHKPSFVFNNKNRFWNSLKTMAFLRSKMKAIDPDTILSFGEYWNSFILLALLGTSFPVFVSDRCKPDKSLGKFHDFLRKKLYPNAAGLIVQTEFGNQIYSSLFKAKQTVTISNPVKTITPRSNIISERIVLSVGRLIASKHHDELIKLFVRLNRPGWKLVIVGGDALKQTNSIRLQQLVNELNANDQVELTGSQADVEAYYLRSKIFAFTSSSEGFPNVIGEAQSAGLPVISFDCIAWASDMVKDGENGYLIPLFDYAAFEQKLGALMDNSFLREKMGTQAKQDIKKFSVDIISKNFLSLLQSSVKK